MSVARNPGYNGWGANQDFSKAFEHYLAASENGSSAASIKLFEMFAYGLGVQKDTQKAEEYFKLGIEQGANLSKENIEDFRKLFSHD